MSIAPIKDRARRIYHIARAKHAWRRVHFPAMWRNHLTATHEFQLLDVLRDIRTVLTLILIVLAYGVFNQPRPITVNVERGETANSLLTGERDAA